MSTEPRFNRWGRVIEPPDAAGVYLLIEIESAEGWRRPPPTDAIRLCQRKPGVPDDDGLNWTTWLQRADLASWMTQAGYVIEEWLPEGVEPDWSTT